jgi:regulatory protein
MAAILTVARRPRRKIVDVALDDGTSFALSLDVAVERGLRPGMDVTPADRRRLEAEDAGRTALAAALRLLAAGPRSERDVRDRLKRRALPPKAIDGAVTRMRELGYLDDSAFARGFVEARQASTPRSRRYLQFELARRGVDREAVAAAVAAVSDDEAAYEAASHRLRALANADRSTFERRLGSFLTSRGFGYGVTRAAIERCWREIHPDF